MVVVGVHSPKFTAEQETENVRKACIRLNLEHPVVSDPTMRMWSEYGVRAWPTLMFVDPTGRVIGKHEGEILAEEFEPVLVGMIREFSDRGTLNAEPLHSKPVSPPVGQVLFPGAVLADERSGRLFIADSGHNCILVADLEGRVHMTVGSGERGLCDGGPNQAHFDSPQGLALDGDRLYVADTWNHAIRVADLETVEVHTLEIAGMPVPREGTA